MRSTPLLALRHARAIVLHALLLGACSDTPTGTPDAPLLARNKSRFTVARVEITPPASLASAGSVLAPGDSAQFSFGAYDAKHRNVPNASATWHVTGGNATVTERGLVRSATSGQITVTAVVNGTTGSYTFTAAGTEQRADSAPPILPAATPSSPSSVAAAVVRFDGGSGQTLVSNGVPLMKGALRAGQESFLHVTVNGAEVPAYVTPLAGTHDDGSLRAVLVQFQTTASATPTPARVEITSSAREAASSLTAPIAPVQSAPGAALLPTDPAYLIASDIVGVTTPASATTAMGGVWARYDADFASWANTHWTNQGDGWDHNYYDRALVYFAQWVRTGNPTYWYRGTRHAVAYRRDYVEPNGYSISPHWSQLEGLEKHYLLTGDQASRTAVARTANTLWTAVTNNGGIGQSNDPRITGRLALATLLAWRLGGAPGVQSDWAGRLDTIIGGVAAWQRADGAFPSGSLFCGGQFNYMVGLMNDALTKVHTYYRQDTRILTAVRRSVDYMWGTQWIGSAQAFKYSSIDCTTGGQEPAGDLTGLIVNAFSWVAKQTGDASYYASGDQVFAASVTQAFLAGDKQFNQAYTSSWRYFGYR